jgi:hypothetical protein
MGRREDSGKLVPLRPGSETGELPLLKWRVAPPQGDESCRWENGDGRWVRIVLGRGDDIGTVIVEDQAGQRRVLDSYEAALALARRWRMGPAAD